MTKQSFLDQAVLSMMSNPEMTSKFNVPQLWSKAEEIWSLRPKTVSESKREVFSKPTVQEVSAYMREKGYTNFTAGKWINFYASKGWKIGKNPMKDWKAAVRTWGEKDTTKKSGISLV